jgi:hypothetical protein
MKQATKARVSVQRRPKLEGPELLAAVAGAFLSFLDLVIGLLAIPFAGAGPLGDIAALSISLRFVFPVYMVLLFISRRALMYACWLMYAVIHVEDCVFALSEKWFSVDVFGFLKAFVVTIVFSSEGLVSLAVALLATYLYREERRARQVFTEVD